MFFFVYNSLVLLIKEGKNMKYIMMVLCSMVLIGGIATAKDDAMSVPQAIQILQEAKDSGVKLGDGQKNLAKAIQIVQEAKNSVAFFRPTEKQVNGENTLNWSICCSQTREEGCPCKSRKCQSCIDCNCWYDWLCSSAPVDDYFK